VAPHGSALAGRRVAGGVVVGALAAAVAVLVAVVEVAGGAGGCKVAARLLQAMISPAAITRPARRGTGLALIPACIPCRAPASPATNGKDGRVAFDDEAAGLAVRWHRLVGSGAEVDSVGSVLIQRWNEPHRVYHATAHLAAVLDRLDDLEGDGVEVTRAVRLAAWFHDAVYDTRRTDNEARSAALATALLRSAGVEVTTVKEVARLVRLTAGHRSDPGDAPGAALCDADLAVLAGCRPDYMAYAAAVRREYRHVPEPAFRQGRIDVLVDLLGRAELYATAAGRRRWEAAARANLAGEIAMLEAEVGK